MIADLFLQAIKRTDEFTKRELFVSMGIPVDLEKRMFEITFPDSSAVRNIIVRTANGLESDTYTVQSC
jgi:hypothetical protein